jgi:nucleoside phosphorylase
VFKQERNIYLHVFDRELRNSLSLKNKFDDLRVSNVVGISLLMSGLPVYVSFSHMYESLDDFPKTIHRLFECEKYGILRMLSNAKNPDEFIASRRHLYKFDAQRYTHYFTGNGTLWPNSLHLLNNDTTAILRVNINKAIETSTSLNEGIKESTQIKLAINRKDAITFPFFKETLVNAYELSSITDYEFQKFSSDIRGVISAEYTRRYLNVFDGTIISGIPGFFAYDGLAKHKLMTNFPVYSMLLQLQKNGSCVDLFDRCFRLRMDSRFSIFHYIVGEILAVLWHVYKDNAEPVGKILFFLNSYHNTHSHDICYEGLSSLDRLLAYLTQLHEHIMQIAERKGYTRMGTNILLVVATQLELNVALSELGGLGIATPIIASNLSYYTLRTTSLTISVVKCQKGSGGVGGSILTLQAALPVLHPQFVIIGGVAFGGDMESQSLGDILISTQIWDYDPEKLMDEGSVPRGAIYPSSARLVQMFEIAATFRNDVNCHFGLLASGSKLVNRKNFVIGDLKKKYTEIIGGDMESGGVAAVCDRHNIDWISVKAICDWGYEKDSPNKDAIQCSAAEKSFGLIKTMLASLNN